ncbi:hypothetical protein OKW49_006911 [Paraburkholderia youngii]
MSSVDSLRIMPTLLSANLPPTGTVAVRFPSAVANVRCLVPVRLFNRCGPTGREGSAKLIHQWR